MSQISPVSSLHRACLISDTSGWNTDVTLKPWSVTQLWTQDALTGGKGWLFLKAQPTSENHLYFSHPRYTSKSSFSIFKIPLCCVWDFLITGEDCPSHCESYFSGYRQAFSYTQCLLVLSIPPHRDAMARETRKEKKGVMGRRWDRKERGREGRRKEGKRRKKKEKGRKVRKKEKRNKDENS